MFSNRLYSPLRYPGGKSRFAPFLSELMKVNDLVGGHYLEPYAGGAGVALDLLFHDIASHVHINDLDPAIASFWNAATKHSGELVELLDRTPVTMEQWHHWREVLREPTEATIVERGFATLFMNRTNRSGILKGGVIGGLSQGGAYKLDARFKKDVLRSRLLKIGEHEENITVHSMDALALLKVAHRFLPLKSLVYLDPPYFVKGQELYRNFYSEKDHKALARFLQSDRFRRRWVVSYDDAPEIRTMYSNCHGIDYELYYSAQSKYRGAELMRFRSGLSVPDFTLGKAAS
jgi:DNA adenine methylase